MWTAPKTCSWGMRAKSSQFYSSVSHKSGFFIQLLCPCLPSSLTSHCNGLLTTLLPLLTIKSPLSYENHDFILFLNFIYLFLGKGRRERGRDINVWLPLVCPQWGPGLQPRHVPWLGTELVTLWFAGPCPTHWGIPARAETMILNETLLTCLYYFQINWTFIMKLTFRRCTSHTLLDSSFLRKLFARILVLLTKY